MTTEDEEEEEDTNSDIADDAKHDDISTYDHGKVNQSSKKKTAKE